MTLIFLPGVWSVCACASGNVCCTFVVFTLPTYSLVTADKPVTWSESHKKLIYWPECVGALGWNVKSCCCRLLFRTDVQEMQKAVNTAAFVHVLLLWRKCNMILMSEISHCFVWAHPSQASPVPSLGPAVWEVRTVHAELWLHHLGQLWCGHWELCPQSGEGGQTLLQRGPWTRQLGETPQPCYTLNLHTENAFRCSWHHKQTCSKRKEQKRIEQLFFNKKSWYHKVEKEV